VQELALRATALINLDRLQEADERLATAHQLCVANDSSHCGEVLRADAKLQLRRGQLTKAGQSLLECVSSAQAHGDRFLEATCLFNAGSVASQREQDDEALSRYRQAHGIAAEIGAALISQQALAGEGWVHYLLGDYEEALALLGEADRDALRLGGAYPRILYLTNEGNVYAAMGQLDASEASYTQAIALARTLDADQAIVDASMDLAEVYIRKGNPDAADRYARQAESMAAETGNPLDKLYTHLIQGQAAALRHDWALAETLLQEVQAASESQPSMRWTAEDALGQTLDAEGKPRLAQRSYQAALASFDVARDGLKQVDTQLPFVANAAHIYDDYIHFLVAQGQPDEALELADTSRAKTLGQGLGFAPRTGKDAGRPFDAAQVARRANATLLFYWLGEKQSYLWAISPGKTMLVPLPARSLILPQLEGYRRALLALKDPLADGSKEDNRDGRALFETLVAPVENTIAQGRPVYIFADGELSQLNFETLIVAGPSPHYWIDDATILSAPSIRMVAAARPSTDRAAKLLLIGDAVSPGPEYPQLPMAAREMQKIEQGFPTAQQSVFRGSEATPASYLASKPEQFSLIHFVAHASAVRTDPLESAVILSPNKSGPGNSGNAPYKLLARDIFRHPIDAQLVTISACNSSGTKLYAGEGLVGLSWAFLGAGAHNAIGALWEVTDESTPELMDRMYAGLGQGKPPAVALREAKLALRHSGGSFHKPFYWAPFQLYAGR
jgi:CHAT domain-containing protein/tetratricopeptide (TPR) repeat protein